MSVAIRLTNVSKSYRLIRQRPFLAKEVLRRVLQRPAEVNLHQALQDVSFVIEKGEAVGVIGINGSGKSTLLSLIARTSYPTTGEVFVHGRVGPLLELGAGFHPDLTGIENIFLNASLLGLNRREVEARLDSIVDFCGIRSFLESPIHTYSTGMKARLGFAVIAHIDPEILIVDEVLAVGDAEFQARCRKAMRSMLESGTTMLLVSHDMPVVRELCRRVLWLEGGRVEAEGRPEEIIGKYMASFEPEGVQGRA